MSSQSSLFSKRWRRLVVTESYVTRLDFKRMGFPTDAPWFATRKQGMRFGRLLALKHKVRSSTCDAPLRLVTAGSRSHLIARLSEASRQEGECCICCITVALQATKRRVWSQSSGRLWVEHGLELL